MKYFLDTEFIEGFHKPFLGKRRHFIDLISIGIVCEDGREYYAISTEFNPKNADEWVKKNVIVKLPQRHADQFDSPRIRREAQLWKTNQQIKDDLLEFFGYKPEWTDFGSDIFTEDQNIEVYAYYADYDWVVFCPLFGRMIDLPNGMPMYCCDLKQMMVERGLTDEWKKKVCPDPEDEHNALADAHWNYQLYKEIMTQDFIVNGDSSKML